VWLEFKNKSIQRVHWNMFPALSPIKSLFQIARRRRTSRIFTTNEFNVVVNLFTSATVVLESHETHSMASENLNRHLTEEYVIPSSKYIWSIPLRYASQWEYQYWTKSNVLLISMPGLYCQLVKLSICIWFTSDNFLIQYERILKIQISCLIQ